MQNQPSSNDPQDVARSLLPLDPEQRTRMLNEIVDSERRIQITRLLQEMQREQAREKEQPEVPSAGAQFVGRYQLDAILGQGGMGTVYRAEQQHPIRRTVALKIIRPGFDSQEVIARFESERQTLARMDHPGIARVLDAGTTTAADAFAPGRPYFVMEYVPGVPITRFADEQRLSVRDRLELFLQVCSAIAHAHTKAIIHRDIKPGNVLAWMQDGKPAVKVIDFGIAKALTGERMSEMTYATGLGQAIGTLEYMSPEQAAGSLDIDTGTDVYALGILLYELLAGTLPFQRKQLAAAAFDEAIRIIRESEPPRPSTQLSQLAQSGERGQLEALAINRQMKADTLLRELRSELEWIPLKALRRERQRRYDSVMQLAEDVTAYLNGRPLRAGPESRLYVARKFVRRNWPAVAAATTITALLIGGFAGTSYGLRKARASERAAVQERDRADEHAREALRQKGEADAKRAESEAVVKFMNRYVFAGATPSSIPDLAVRNEIVKKMLDPAADAVQVLLPDQPLVRAAVMNQIANAYVELGRYEEADPLYAQAKQLRLQILGETHADTLVSLNNAANNLAKLGKLKEADEEMRRVVALAKASLGMQNATTLASLYNHADTLWKLNKLEEAETAAKEAFDGREQLLGPDDQDTLAALNTYGLVMLAKGDAPSAEKMFKDCLERSRRIYGDYDPRALATLNNYAYALGSQGKFAEAEPFQREALERTRHALGDDHPDTIGSLNNYAFVLRTLDRLPEAEPLQKEAMERSKRVFGESHQETLRAMNNYAGLLDTQGKSAEAEPYFGEVVRLRRSVLGSDHPATAWAMNNHGRTLQKLGRYAEAEPLMRESTEKFLTLLGADNIDRLWARHQYANVLIKLERYPEAEAVSRELLSRAEVHPELGPGHQDTKDFAARLVTILDLQSKAEEAATLRKRLELPADPTTSATMPAR